MHESVKMSNDSKPHTERRTAPFHERKSEMKGSRSSASVASHLILAWPRTGSVLVRAHPTVRIPCGWKQIRECELGGISLKPGWGWSVARMQGTDQ